MFIWEAERDVCRNTMFFNLCLYENVLILHDFTRDPLQNQHNISSQSGIRYYRKGNINKGKRYLTKDNINTINRQ